MFCTAPTMRWAGINIALLSSCDTCVGNWTVELTACYRSCKCLGVRSCLTVHHVSSQWVWGVVWQFTMCQASGCEELFDSSPSVKPVGVRSWLKVPQVCQASGCEELFESAPSVSSQWLWGVVWKFTKCVKPVGVRSCLKVPQVCQASGCEELFESSPSVKPVGVRSCLKVPQVCQASGCEELFESSPSVSSQWVWGVVWKFTKCVKPMGELFATK